MSLPQRTSVRRSSLAIMGAVVALGGVAAQPAMAARSRTSQTDHASAALPAAVLAGDVQQATGYSASQLSTRAACGAQPGTRIRCYARVLTVRSTGRPASPRAPSVPTGASAPVTADSAPEAYTSAYLQWAYDTTWLAANQGAADTVAIVDAYGDSTAYSDMEQFRSANGLPSIPTCGGSVTTSCFERVNQYGQAANLPGNGDDETVSSGSGWNIEESLDIDAVSSLCPLCKILMVEANSDDSDDLPDLETAVSTAASLGANQISLSWGGDTSPDAPDFSAPYDSISNSAIFAAAGDYAYPGPNVGYPAALADVTAVGGTSLTADPAVARGFSESAWSDTESGCDTSQPVPSYQNSATTGCNGRAYSDISADADADTGLEIYDSQPGAEGCGGDGWCIVGGTSLATPLVAAYDAITGISDTTPAWTYTDANYLNDIVSGSDGTCPSGRSLICNTAIGWDGPTGNGSISGDIATGAPGIGVQPDATSVGMISADVSASVDPNDSGAGANTTYHWQYGPTTSYGSATPSTPLSAGTSFQSASTTLTFTEPCTYHYRVVASNAVGTGYGYDHTVTSTMVASGSPVPGTPTITGTAAIGQQLSAQSGTWSGGYDCDTTYQWQRASSPDASSWTPISGATGASYTPTASDTGEYLEVVVSGSNTAGSGSAISAATAPVPAPPVTTTTTASTPTSTTSTTSTTPATSLTIPTTSATPTTTSAPTTTTTRSSTTSTTRTSGAPMGSATSTTTVRFYRCARSCRLLHTHGADSYTPRRADYGRYIKVVTTLTRIVGKVATESSSTRWVGPITSTMAGDVSLGSGARVASALIVRGASGRSLAQVRVVRHRAGHGATRLTLVVRRKTAASTRAWAYVLSGGRVVSATRAHSLRRPVTLSVALKRGQTIRLVAVTT
ncbi:MAG: hypothetical protein ACRDLT_10275 [Solirubrobacteraceae bacterium]